MELRGRIIRVLPLKSGLSASSGKEWCKQEYVIETREQYPKQCCFEVFGQDKIDNFNLVEGDNVTVKLDIDAHEYNGRWYNTITAWAVEHDHQRQYSQRQPRQQPPQQQPTERTGGMPPETESQVSPRAGGISESQDLPF